MGPLSGVAMAPGRGEGDSARGTVSLAAMATSHYRLSGQKKEK